MLKSLGDDVFRWPQPVNCVRRHRESVTRKWKNKRDIQVRRNSDKNAVAQRIGSDGTAIPFGHPTAQYGRRG